MLMEVKLKFGAAAAEWELNWKMHNHTSKAKKAIFECEFYKVLCRHEMARIKLRTNEWTGPGAASIQINQNRIRQKIKISLFVQSVFIEVLYFFFCVWISYCAKSEPKRDSRWTKELRFRTIQKILLISFIRIFVCDNTPWYAICVYYPILSLWLHEWIQHTLGGRGHTISFDIRSALKWTLNSAIDKIHFLHSNLSVLSSKSLKLSRADCIDFPLKYVIFHTIFVEMRFMCEQSEWI